MIKKKGAAEMRFLFFSGNLYLYSEKLLYLDIYI